MHLRAEPDLIPGAATSHRLLLCRPQWGFNDLLTQIERVCAYAEKYGRTVIVDTNYHQSDYFRDDLSNYLTSRSSTLALSAMALPAGVQQMDVHPKFLAGRLGRYGTHFEPGRNFLEDETGKRISFDFGRDYSEPLLVHHSSGGNQSSVLALKRVWLNGALAGALLERLRRIGSAYTSVHVRNTDYTTAYHEPIARLKAISGPVFVATDSAPCLAYCMETLGPGRVFSFAALPETDSASLHKTRQAGNAYQRNSDAGEDRSMTVAAFTGGARLLLLRPFDFMDVTGMMHYDRILLRDPTKSWFHLGFGEPGGSFDSVVQTVRNLNLELKGEKVMTIGTSMGGYAALLAGHALGADYVHAFSPQTNLGAESIAQLDDLELAGSSNLARVHARLGPDAEILDLRRVLARPNGKTRYFIHVCSGRPLDLKRAERLAGLPQVEVLRYPCNVHNVLIGMAPKRFLRTALTLEEQDTLVERHAQIFGGMAPKIPDARRKMDTALGEPLNRVGRIVHSVSRERLLLKEILASRDLIAALSLDSMNLLEIIVGLENEFGIEVDPESVSAEDFRTVASMLAIVWAA